MINQDEHDAVIEAQNQRYRDENTQLAALYMNLIGKTIREIIVERDKRGNTVTIFEFTDGSAYTTNNETEHLYHTYTNNYADVWGDSVEAYTLVPLYNHRMGFRDDAALRIQGADSV